LNGHMSRDALGTIGAILAGAVLIAGSILYTGPRNEELSYLRSEVARLEGLLDSSLKALHHERLLHSGEEVKDHGEKEQ